MTASATSNASDALNWSQTWPAGWFAYWVNRSAVAERPTETASDAVEQPAADGPDAEWISRICQGDETAATALIDRLHPTVMKIVRSRLPRRTLEEDLAQTIFAKIFRSLHQFSGRVPLEHWVSRIALNTCINQLKHEASRPEWRMSDLSEEQAAVVEHLTCSQEEVPIDGGRAARELLAKLLAPLRDEDRLVITLLHLEERSVAEIAEITGWSASLVKVKAFRARHKMRRAWRTLVKQ